MKLNAIIDHKQSSFQGLNNNIHVREVQSKLMKGEEVSNLHNGLNNRKINPSCNSLVRNQKKKNNEKIIHQNKKSKDCCVKNSSFGMKETIECVGIGADTLSYAKKAYHFFKPIPNQPPQNLWSKIERFLECLTWEYCFDFIEYCGRVYGIYSKFKK